MTRLPFPEVYALPIYEFFNLLSYSRDKAQKQAEQIKQMQKQ